MLGFIRGRSDKIQVSLGRRPPGEASRWLLRSTLDAEGAAPAKVLEQLRVLDLGFMKRFRVQGGFNG